MKRIMGLLIIVASFWSGMVNASDLLMIRSTQSFPETMLSLQDAIKKQGYTVSRVQRIDIGLTSSGYQTDKYRVVFFGKNDELQPLINRHPNLIAYLPWKIVLIAEGEETLLVTHNPISFSQFFKDKELSNVFEKWSVDLLAIMDQVRDTE